MNPRRFFPVAILVVVLALTLPPVVRADIVGRITQIEGRVDLLKGGKLPATPVKLQDGVEPGDVLRTKSLSKAQITFIDNTTLTLSPQCRIAVEDYMFDPAQKKRNAVLNIFQGLAHVVVSKLFKVEDPDFVVKTNTAVTGVRGTDFGVRLYPNSTTILNFAGVTQVGNIFPEVGQLSRRAAKVAFAWNTGGHYVTLQAMQATTVAWMLPPTMAYNITIQDQQQFLSQCNPPLVSRGGGQGSGAGSGAGGGGGTGGGATSLTSLGGTDSGLGATGGGSSSVAFASPGGITGSGDIFPAGTNYGTIQGSGGTGGGSGGTGDGSGGGTGGGSGGSTGPTTQTYAFIQTSQTTWNSTGTGPGTLDPSTGLYYYPSNSVSTTGWGVRTGVATADAQALPDSYAGYFTSSGTGDRSVVSIDGVPQGSGYPATSTGVSTSTLTGTVTGVSGGTLMGTGTMTGTSSFGQTFSYTGTITIDSSGTLTFTYNNGTITSQARLSSASGTSTAVPGTYFTQTLSGAMSNTSSAPYTSQTTTTVPGTGAATSSGLPSTYYAVSVSGSATPQSYNPWRFNYLAQSYDSLTGTVQGVLSGQQGAATIYPSGQDQPFVSALPTPPSPYLFGSEGNANTPIVTTVNINPSTGVVSGEVHTTDYQDGKYVSQVYNLTQTPQASPVTPITGTYAFAETYTGAFMLNSFSLSPGGTQSSGYGYRSGEGALASYYDGYFASFDNGTWTATSGSLPTSWYGSALVSGAPGTPNPAPPGVTMISGSVSGTLGQTLTGTMTWYGSLLNGASFNYQGTVTLDSYGDLKFVYGGGSGSASWVYPNGASGTAAGTMYQYPGYYFTQTMPGTYQLITSAGYNGTLTLAGNTSTRSVWNAGNLVYAENLGPFSGTFSLNSPTGSLPEYSSGAMSSPMTMEGVVGTSWLGANFGAASLTINTSLTGSITVPGNVSLSPGGTYFVSPGVFTPSNLGPIQVISYTGSTTLPTALTQLPLYSFSETFQGFRISAGSAPFTLASVEGYGWGQSTSSIPSSLNYNYTGYFVSQDLGTRASLSAMTPGWAGVTGSMTGSLSGTPGPGQTLTGQMAFTGSSSLGVTYNYQGNVTLASNGTLVWNYYGTWTNSSGTNSGTASGTWTQVLGTYFSETVNNGTFVQAATTTTSGGTTFSIATLKDAAPFAGTRTMSGANTNITGSAAGSLASTVNQFPSGPNTGSGSLTIQGVVAGSSWQTRWGVATATSPITGSASISGPVTLDPSGKLTGQFVDSVPNGTGQPDSVTVNYVSVPTGSGQTTSSFVQTVSGQIAQTPIGSTPGTQGSLATVTPLSGTGTGTISGDVNANVALTSTAVTPTYVTAGTAPMTAVITGAVGGPAGGPQTGVASMHSIKTIAGNARLLHHVGTATFTPATGSTPATVTATLNGMNLSHSGVQAVQKGTVTVTPK